ncbi:nuclear transport factor 2 family protein [Maribacter sp. HTCC2170]|uniref:nuclear transport factor 2 family protein n=1 Tax=Maribacter sp. (strain HTCC2170 / KCCM 42371) TaxID=313603 RepID=UPI00006B488F|nr:nuclear transport factor 2 family protein [Maribacter sp. HTCC2170]EAR01685.1 hypothetical protein FB2170_14193 [Maribacter sp. HTCC2170]
MKKFILIIAIIFGFSSCQQGAERYTQNSPEIDTVKKLIANYNSKSYDTSMYTDTSKTFYNTKKNSMSPSETMAYHQETDKVYKSRGFLDEDQEYEMVLTDDGNTWVNCWLDWKGTLVGNNKEYNIPIHLTYQFENGKIVREHGHWDSGALVSAMQEIEIMNNLPPEENRAVVNGMYQNFAKGDVPSVLASLDPNVVWMEAEGNAYADGNPYQGPDAVLNGIFTRIGDDYEFFHLKNIKLHEMANDEVLATLRYDGKLKANGAKINAQAAHLWTLRNGKVIRFQQYVDTKQLHDAINK